MQPLTMAMRRGQAEEDNNNDHPHHHHHVSQLSSPGHHDDNARSDLPSPQQEGPHHHHHHHHPFLPHHRVSPDIKPPSDSHASSPQHLRTQEAGGFLLDAVVQAPEQRQQSVAVSRPGHLFPDSAFSPAEECNDSFCHLASSTVDSDSSSSPDINSNTLLVGFRDSDPSRGENEDRTPPWVSRHAPIVAKQETVKSVTASSLDSVPLHALRGQVVGGGAGGGGGGAHTHDEPVMTGGEDRTKQEHTSASCLPAVVGDSGTTGENVQCEEKGEDWNPARPQSGDVPSEETRNYLNLAIQQSSMEMVGCHSGLAITEACSSGDFSQQEGAGLYPRAASQRVFPADVSSRQSVDMDVECEGPEEVGLVSEGNRSFCPSEIPSSQAGHVGESHTGPASSVQFLDTAFLPVQSVDTVSHKHRTFVPVLILTEPSVSSIQGNSPETTTLFRTKTTVHSDTFSNIASPRDDDYKESSCIFNVETETMQSSSADVEAETMQSSSANVEAETMQSSSANVEAETMQSSSANVEAETMQSSSADVEAETMQSSSADVEAETMQFSSADVDAEKMQFFSTDVEAETNPFSSPESSRRTSHSSSSSLPHSPGVDVSPAVAQSWQSSRRTSHSSSSSLPHSPGVDVSPAVAQSWQSSWRTDESHDDGKHADRSRSSAHDLQEEDLEDELCGFTHYPALSWNGEVPPGPTSGDRVDLPDPVATLLTEGDHTHFIPIAEEEEEESAVNHAAGPPATADPASNTPG